MIKSFNNMAPKNDALFVAENATVIGEVELKPGSSVWYGAVIRGDMGKITVGENSNVQDNATLHSSISKKVTIGNNVTIGHNAVIHGCTIEDNCLIGMNSTILNGAVIGKNSIVGAGALITENKVFPENSMIIGVPAKAVREIGEEYINGITENAKHYVSLAKEHNKIK